MYYFEPLEIALFASTMAKYHALKNNSVLWKQISSLVIYRYQLLKTIFQRMIQDSAYLQKNIYQFCSTYLSVQKIYCHYCDLFKFYEWYRMLKLITYSAIIFPFKCEIWIKSNSKFYWLQIQSFFMYIFAACCYVFEFFMFTAHQYHYIHDCICTDSKFIDKSNQIPYLEIVRSYWLQFQSFLGTHICCLLHFLNVFSMYMCTAHQYYCVHT